MQGKSFSERFRSKNAAKAAVETAAARSKTRVDRSAYLFVKLHLVQLERFEKMNDPVAFMLFGILLRESFDHRGKAFELPTGRLTSLSGLRNVGRLRDKLRKLEQHGLISIAARASQPMLILVPLSF